MESYTLKLYFEIEEIAKIILSQLQDSFEVAENCPCEQFGLYTVILPHICKVSFDNLKFYCLDLNGNGFFFDLYHLHSYEVLLK